MTASNTQFGFDALLAETDTLNIANAFAKQTEHLPDTMDAAIPFHREQIKTHHQAMLECRFEDAVAIREDAHLLARKLSGNQSGILADDDAPGCVLSRACAADTNAMPLWGQDGSFVIDHGDIPIHIEIEGMFGIGAKHMPYAGFSARAVDVTKPFISETGYRCFLGCSVEAEMGMTPKDFVSRLLEHFIRDDLKGKLVTIAERYRKNAGYCPVS